MTVSILPDCESCGVQLKEVPGSDVFTCTDACLERRRGHLAAKDFAKADVRHTRQYVVNKIHRGGSLER